MSIWSHNTGLNLDEFEMFKLWYELGSAKKVQQYLIRSGVVNPDSGKPINEMTIKYNAKRWVLEHPEEAREYYLRAKASFAYEDENWNIYLVKTARKVYQTSKGRFLNWIERRGFGKKYEYLYAEQFGLIND